MTGCSWQPRYAHPSASYHSTFNGADSLETSLVIYVAFMLGFSFNIEIHGLQKVFWDTLKVTTSEAAS